MKQVIQSITSNFNPSSLRLIVLILQEISDYQINGACSNKPRAEIFILGNCVQTIPIFFKTFMWGLIIVNSSTD